ncbi:MAG: hypothetical protein K2L49_04175, partial [Muribaculaceae bacterium]|nr:hypothetical protein [Muribaculaceae bacterium]
NHFVYFEGATPQAQIQGWETSWFIFAAYALAVAILFWIIFRDDNGHPAISRNTTAMIDGEDPEGMASSGI